MVSQPEQFPLALALDKQATFENFWAEHDRQLVDTLYELSVEPASTERATPAWFYVNGADASGVSHLLQASIAQAQLAGHNVMYLSLAELQQAPGADWFAGLEHCALLCIDELEVLVQQPALQQSLLFLLERSRAQGGSIVLGASVPAVQLDYSLADLKSRLCSATQFRIQSRSDEDIAQILQFRAERIGLAMPNEVARFVLSRCSRSLRDLLVLLDELDQLALARQRRLTIPFVKDSLAI